MLDSSAARGIGPLAPIRHTLPTVGGIRNRLMAMHYPRRVSKIKRVRQFGFRARMKTKAGRKMINRKRSLGRRLTPDM